MKKESNMYPWVDITKNFVGGKCPHECVYCYVNSLRKKFDSLNKKYSGKLFLLEKEFEKPLPTGKTIFIQNCGDLFAEGVPTAWIGKVLAYCNKFDNTYLFQTKNVERLNYFTGLFPHKTILGTTLETTMSSEEYAHISKAPEPMWRAFYLSWPFIERACRGIAYRRMVSIEPILAFDPKIMLGWIRSIQPEFVSIGADSKHTIGLSEPTSEQIKYLIEELNKITEVRLKGNLKRLLDGPYDKK